MTIANFEHSYIKKRGMNSTMIFVSNEDYEELQKEMYELSKLMISENKKTGDKIIFGIRILRSFDLKKGEWYFL